VSASSATSWRGAGPLPLRAVLGGAACGLLVSLSPLTPSLFGEHFWTSLSVGVLAGVAAAWLLRARAPAPRLVGPALAAVMTPARWLTVAALALAFLPTAAWLWSHWTFSLWRDIHGLLVPIAMGMLARRTLVRALPLAPAGSALGYAALAPAVALLALGFARSEPLLGAVALVLALPALSLLVLGPALTKSLWPVWLLGAFMLPAPLESPLHQGLMRATAAAVEPLLGLAGIDAVRQEAVLHVGDQAFAISESCSGVSILYAMGFVGLTLSCVCRSPRRRAAVALLAIPLAFATNAVRVTALVVTSLAIGSDFLDTPIHKGTGGLAFMVGFALLAALAGRGPLRVIAGLPEDG